MVTSERSQGKAKKRPRSARKASTAYDLRDLDAATFQHLANALALKVLGPGVTFFCSGADGGRDGLFQGAAPYPSTSEPWSGMWYIQSKYHAPHLTADSQKWLLKQIRDEIKKFQQSGNDREWPDNWIFVSNVDPSAKPSTGTFDQAIKLVRRARPQLASHFAIWGGSKIKELLATHEDVASKYGHFITPGHILAELRSSLSRGRASEQLIRKVLIIDKLEENKSTRLEEAGSENDVRPPIHKVFVDLPFACPAARTKGFACQLLSSALAENHNEANALLECISQMPQEDDEAG